MTSTKRYLSLDPVVYLESDERQDLFPVDTLIHAKIESESWKLANDPEEDEDVDASWTGSDLITGLGWSLKEDRSGETLGLQGCRRSLSALHAELESLLWAMSCMKDRLILSVHFQTDCLDLVSMSESPSDWPSFLSELEIFRNLRESFLNFTLSHIPRSSNVRADNLTKEARAKGIFFPKSFITSQL
ncbi:hypothetical protein EUTSA_v10019496mg [Eutrema salsugineum]|uniref:RNase H type-1 domain-containing protein n=1 Tax=Eutrema salsugineum TaxID=72664 RepID=V4M9C6_EUTSA|nr:hypothetical protein EUTSA_v10019496mg [Eutrema salsugineum]